MRCRRCPAEVPTGDHWCERCGLWASSEQAVCEGEELRPATGACVVCGTPVCDACGVQHEGVTYCADASHRGLQETHVLLGRYGSMFEADWICRNLENGGIGARMFEYRSHPGLYGLTLAHEASVYVLREQQEAARGIIDQYAEKKGT